MLSLLCVLVAHAAAAEPIAESRRNALVRAIEKAAPAVVTINVVQIQRERVIDPRFGDFLNLFGFGPMGAVRERRRVEESLGTGFIFDRQGHILTNQHVLQGADAISSVTLSDGRVLEVSVVGVDERTDLAVLRATGEGLPFIPPGRSDDLMPGEWVISIGNPFGKLMRDPQPSVSVGVVSANHRRVQRDVGRGERLYQDMIQTDAAINPGNSGGPLVNALGEVVGVNTMIFTNSGGYQGIGFAIPMNRALRVAEELIEHGRRRDPWFGFRGEAVLGLDAYTRRELGIPDTDGVIVTEIHKEAPAFQAGLRPGDIVVAVNGERVSDPTDVDFINWALFPGDSVRMEAERSGKMQQLVFTVREFTRR